MAHEVLVSTRKGLFSLRHSNDAPHQWKVTQRTFIGDNVTLALHDRRSGYRYAALDHGHFGPKLHRSRDGGATWEEIATPEYPEQPEGVSDQDPNTKEDVAWSTKLLWELAAGGDDQPGRLWCGTIPGGLFRSDDHGESWVLNRALWDNPARKEWMGGGTDLPGLHTILLDPRNARRIIVAVSCGGIWITEDDGESWELKGSGIYSSFMPPERADDLRIQDIHRLALCRSQPDRIWCQHHGGIFRSDDGGATFSEITDVAPSPFGFGVVAHPLKPDTAWFVPADSDQKRTPIDGTIVALRTDDAGQSFHQQRDGLPQQDAYDLVYRHALAIDSTDGELLAFGSTTGALWISTNGGQSWRETANHLPPIYAVTIAQAN